MKVLDWTRDKLSKPTIVTWGIFDGVHRAHQSLIKNLLRLAKRDDFEPVVITFSKHPAEVLTRQRVKLIVPLEKRLELFDKLGVQNCVLINFTRTFAKTSGADFIKELRDRFNTKFILLGYDSRFGYMRKYGENELQNLASDFGVRIVRHDLYKSGFQIVSSSIIRDLLSIAKLPEAKRLLGRDYSISGKVVKGSKLGSKIGFPTANIQTKCDILIPQGVYKTIVCVSGVEYKSITHFGVKPTLKVTTPVVETHLIRYSGDSFYGEQIEVKFLQKIRDIMRFNSLNELVKQIRKDIVSIK